MKICCLMPTFGRSQELIESSIECFLRQTHPDKMLVGLDDSGREDGRRGDKPHWCILSMGRRAKSLTGKYDFLWNQHEADAYCVWDDDDVYLPWHLASHAQALKSHFWSHPASVWSTCRGRPRLEPAAGRFHGSMAVWRDALKHLGGWLGVMPDGEIHRADFDQRMLTALRALGVPGDPCEHAPPSYVFRWADTGARHCQARMIRPDDTTWYTDAQPQHTEPWGEITPGLDHSAKRLFAALARTGS